MSVVLAPVTKSMVRPQWFRSLSLAAIALLGAPSVWAQQPALSIQPGMWSVDIAIEPPGVPPGQVKPVARSACVSRGEAADFGRFLLTHFSPPGCTAVNPRQSGNRITFGVACPKGGAGGGSVSGETRGDSFQATVRDRIEVDKGKPLELRLELAGKRTGDC